MTTRHHGCPPAEKTVPPRPILQAPDIVKTPCHPAQPFNEPFAERSRSELADVIFAGIRGHATSWLARKTSQQASIGIEPKKYVELRIVECTVRVHNCHKSAFRVFQVNIP